MLSRPLGSSGIDVSLLGLGCNSLGHIPTEEGERLVAAALDRGVTFCDTANVYAAGRSEAELGRLIPRGRHDILIATKFGHPASVPAGLAPCAALRAKVVRRFEERFRARSAGFGAVV